MEKNGSEFNDIKSKLQFFFDDIKDISSKINKIVHKQSYRYFYTMRNHFVNQKKHDKEKFMNDYIYYLEKNIGIVAVMRLVIDPMPIIIDDYEIYSRTEDTLTKQYPSDFIEKYIEQNIIEKYKESELYQNHYKMFMQNEQMNETTSDIIKNQYVDILKKDEIEKQYHLIGDWNLNSAFLISNIEKVCKVHVCDGIQTYFLDRKSNRKKVGFDSRFFTRFLKSKNRFNQEYDETYISVININQDYFLEHNEKFTEDEILEFKNIENHFNNYPED